MSIQTWPQQSHSYASAAELCVHASQVEDAQKDNLEPVEGK